METISQLEHMETLEHVAYSLMVNVGGSSKSDSYGKMFMNIEFRTRNEDGEIKLRNIRISVSEFVSFLQELLKVQAESIE
ncbi:Leptin receptor [Dirofilaria immitis]